MEPARPLGRELAGSLGSRRYYHTDLLGSVRVAESAAGSVEQAQAYDAWGVRLQRDALVAGEPVPVREGFMGKEREAAVGGEPKMWDVCWMLTTEAGEETLKRETAS